MANTTDADAGPVHGTNPQNMVEYIIRRKIQDSLYWKQHCFGLSAQGVVEKATELRYVGGMYGEPRHPSEFLCLLLKMLQIGVPRETLLEYLKAAEFKYVRLLGATYLRLTARAEDVYRLLEPLRADYRRARVRDLDGRFRLTHIDEVVDDLLSKKVAFDIAMPALQKRTVLEARGAVPPRASPLMGEYDRDRGIREAEGAREGRWGAEGGTDGAEATRVRGPDEPMSGPPPAADARTDALLDDARRAVEEREAGSRWADPPGPSEGRPDHSPSPPSLPADGGRPKAGLRERRRSPSPWRLGPDERRAARERERRRRESRDGGWDDRDPVEAGARGGRDPPTSRRDRDRRQSRWEDPGAGSEPSPGAKRPRAEDDEIAQANALRASLGLKPLRQ